MQEYNVNHITSSPHYPQSNGLAEKFVQIVKKLFHIAREEGTDLHKALMIYRNTPLSSNLQSPMQLLQSRTVRSQLPMSNVARQQLGLQAERLRIKTKNEQLPSHDLCLEQSVMMQDPTNQEMVTSSDNQALQGTKKLSSPHKRRGNLQEDAVTPKTIHTQ